jgi:hypothetical protein
MRDLFLFALAGFLASLVDGALGMGFGPTSSSILLGVGLAPTAVSASVNIAKVATGIAAAISHWRFMNVDRRLVLNLAIPGAIGALAGVTVLRSIPGNTLRPYLALLLIAIGVRILIRFAHPVERVKNDQSAPDARGKRILHYDSRGVTVAAFIGGVTNGLIGAWGPVVTPFLLHRGVRPRFAIGCVNTAEVAVAGSAAFTLVATLGRGGFNAGVVLAMLGGGVIAAPVAAWVIRRIPPRPLGVAVAALLLFTNAREVVAWAGVGSGMSLWLVYGVLAGAVVLAFIGWGTPATSRVSADKESSADKGSSTGTNG